MRGNAILRGHFLARVVVLAGIVLGAAGARADDMATARQLILKGDLTTAQLTLRKMVSQDPQNGEAHYWLGRVSLDLGDPVAGETQARAAQARGYDALQTTRLLGQALLAQNKFDQVLSTITPGGTDPAREAIVQVLRGYALLGTKQVAAASAAFVTAEKLAPDAIEPPLAESRLALLRGDLAAAQAPLDRALSLQPAAPEALLAKAQLLRMQGHPEDAVQVLDALLAAKPNLPDMVQGRVDRASLELALGRLKDAKADLDAVLAVTPANVPALYLQAAMAAQAKDYGLADQRLTRISAYLDRVPRSWLLVAMVKEQLGQLEQADTAAQRYLAQAPTDTAGYDIAARILFDKDRPDLVIKTLLPLVGSGQADKGTYELLGGAYAATGQTQQAIEAYQKAQLLAPRDVTVQTTLASLRIRLGQPSVAMVDLEHTLALAPTLPRVGEALFFAALATGDLDASAQALAKIKAVQGDTALVGHLEGLQQQASLNIAQAQQSFVAVLRKYPDYIPAKISLAHLLAVEGHTEAADKLLAEILEKQPASEPALTLLVGDVLAANRPGDAIGLLQRARAADPSNPDLVVRLGNILIRTGEARKALDLLGQLPNEQRTRPELQGMKAAAELRLGQQETARATLAALLAQTPTDLEARRALTGLLLAAGQVEAARNVVRDGMAAMPRTYLLMRDYVMIALKANGLDAALAAADQLASQDQGFPPARDLRGEVYEAAGRTDDAIAAFAAAFTAAPSSPLLLRLVAARLRYGHIDDARTDLLQWLARQPTDQVARQRLAQVDIFTHRWDEAAETLRTLLDDHPHDPVALNNLAWVYLQQNDGRALGLARQAYVLAPDVQNTDTLGWILTEGGHPDLGVLLLHQADVVSKGDPTMRYHYAVALKDLGQRAQAIALLGTVVAAKQDFADKPAAQALLDALRKGS